MTYAQLVNAVLAYFGNAGNPDPNFEAYMPTIVEIAESRVYAAIRDPMMLQSSYVKDLSQAQEPPYRVPERMLEPYRMTDGENWEYLAPERFFEILPNTSEKYWTIYGGELALSQSATDTLVFTWYDKPLPLAEADNTRLFQLYPELFLQGSLVEAARFLREADSTTAMLEDSFLKTLRQVGVNAWNSHIPRGQPLRMRGTTNGC